MENCWEQAEQLAAGQIINKDMPRLDNRKYEVRGYHWDLMEDLQSDRPLQRSTQCVNKSLQAAPLNWQINDKDDCEGPRDWPRQGPVVWPLDMKIFTVGITQIAVNESTLTVVCPEHKT